MLSIALASCNRVVLPCVVRAFCLLCTPINILYFLFRAPTPASWMVALLQQLQAGSAANPMSS